MDTTAVIKKIIITEKSHQLEANNVFTVEVHPDATKVDVRNAVESHYGRKVEKVRILPIIEKKRNVGRGRSITKRHGGLKALITLQKGEKPLDFLKLKK